MSADYPRHPCVFRHALAGRAELGTARIVTAAAALPPGDAELRRADGSGFDRLGQGARAIERAAKSGKRWWLMLRDPQRHHAAYRTLMDDLVASVAPVVERVTGPMLRPRLFLFVSTGGSHTPPHMDAEYNLFFQIEGGKRFTVADASSTRADDHIRLHRFGDNLLEPAAAHARAFRLGPGDGLYVPYKAPHWVDVDAGAPSVSLSLTWASRWSLEQEAAWRAHARLGALLPRPPEWPARARVRAGIGRIMDRWLRA